MEAAHAQRERAALWLSQVQGNIPFHDLCQYTLFPELDALIARCDPHEFVSPDGAVTPEASSW